MNLVASRCDAKIPELLLHVGENITQCAYNYRLSTCYGSASNPVRIPC